MQGRWSRSGSSFVSSVYPHLKISSPQTLQVAEEFNSWLLRVIEEGEALCDRRS
jgi:hypothetical protein